MKYGRRKTLCWVAVVFVVYAIALVLIKGWNYRNLPLQLVGIAAMDGKMVFYGKVVDHRGEPVPGATVNYHTITTLQNLRAGYSVAETLTNERGEFKIGPKSGIGLGIESIEKENYRYGAAGYKFDFGYGSNSDPHRPDSNHPVPFLMVPAEMRFTDIVRANIWPSAAFHWNSAPVEVPLGETGELLIFRPTRDKATGEKRGYAWKVEIEIKNGEILMREKKDLIPLAPLEGYQKQVVIGHERDAWRWGGALSDRQFIFRTDDGHYGRFNLSLDSNREDGRPAALVKRVAFNPSGERSLD
jgi:hypothetical protein